MKIELKDLVWKEVDREKELKILRTKYCDILHSKPYEKIIDIFDEYFEKYQKEKAEINNKQIEYTKDDIIEMFVEAGFEYGKTCCFIFRENNRALRVTFFSNEERFYFNYSYGNSKESQSMHSVNISYNDRQSIEFYYNTFREILKFEVENE